MYKFIYISVVRERVRDPLYTPLWLWPGPAYVKQKDLKTTLTKDPRVSILKYIYFSISTTGIINGQ